MPSAEQCLPMSRQNEALDPMTEASDREDTKKEEMGLPHTPRQNPARGSGRCNVSSAYNRGKSKNESTSAPKIYGGSMTCCPREASLCKRLK